MTKGQLIQEGSGSGPVAAVRVKSRKPAAGVYAKESRAPMQILKETKQWLDQIIEEKKFRTYDEAIMFLIKERQKNLPPEFWKVPGST
jgi:hypothetical protein